MSRHSDRASLANRKAPYPVPRRRWYPRSILKWRAEICLALLSCVRRTHHAACNQQSLPEDNLDNAPLAKSCRLPQLNVHAACQLFAIGVLVRDIAPSSKARELWVGLEENAALALLQNIRIYALNLSQLREIRKRLMLPVGNNRSRYIAANSEHAP
jgi:hypothetical protein